jgi:hypothetical protein
MDWNGTVKDHGLKNKIEGFHGWEKTQIYLPKGVARYARAGHSFKISYRSQ